MSIDFKLIDINLLDPEFCLYVSDFLEKSPYDWLATAGYRSLKTQSLLYDVYLRGGPKAAPPGESAHNYGLAIDVVLLVNGVPSWNTKLKGWVWLKIKSIPDPHLTNGWRFNDYCHIERYKWRGHINVKAPQA